MPVDASKATVQDTGGEFELLPEGMYTAQVTDINLEEGVESKYGKKDKFYFTLGILDEEERAKKLMHFTTTAYNAGFTGGSSSKLYDTACAIMGEQLDAEQPLDVNTLIGGRLRIVVKHQVSKKDGKTYANITEVMKSDVASKKLPELTDAELAEVNKPREDKMSDAEMESISRQIDDGGVLDNPVLDEAMGDKPKGKKK